MIMPIGKGKVLGGEEEEDEYDGRTRIIAEKERVHCTAFFSGPPEAALPKVARMYVRLGNDSRWADAG
jgi:hypothetical protein